jgi:type I restriction enzyme, S subunit
MSERNGEGSAGWRTTKLGDLIVEAVTGFACGQRATDGVIQLRMNNVTRRGELDWSSFIRVPAEKQMVDAYGLHVGDVVFNNTNSTEMVGKTAIFSGFGEPVVFSNHFTRLRTKADALVPDFLALWLHNQWQAGLFARICDRWIGQSAVQRSKLLALEIPLPALEEQRRIAARLREQLSSVAEARGALEAQLAAAESLPAAHLRSAFESEEAKLWPRKRIAQICQIIPGRHILEENHNRIGRGVAYLTGPSDFGERQATATRWTVRPDVMCEPRDILVTVKGAGVAKINFAPDEPACIGRQLMAVRCLPELTEPNFVFYALRFVQEQLRSHAIGATVPGLSIEHLANLEISIPEIHEQQVISARLDDAFVANTELESSLRTKLSELKKLSAAILRSAFSPNGD